MDCLNSMASDVPPADCKQALEKLETALRFQRNGLPPTADEGVEFMLALKTVRERLAAMPPADGEKEPCRCGWTANVQPGATCLRCQGIVAAAPASLPPAGPTGWVTMWPTPTGDAPVYSHGPKKPSYGPMNDGLSVTAVYASPPAGRGEPVASHSLKAWEFVTTTLEDGAEDNYMEQREDGHWYNRADVATLLATPPAGVQGAVVSREDFDRKVRDLDNAKKLLTIIWPACPPHVQRQINQHTGAWFALGANRDEPSGSAGATEGNADGVKAVAPSGDDEAQSWAWEQVRRQVGTEGWTTGDACNYFGFFCWGWRYRDQLEKQRADGTSPPAHEAPADAGGKESEHG